MLPGDQQGVAWITGAYREKGEELLRLLNPVRRFHALDDPAEDAGAHAQILIAPDRVD